MNKPFFVIIDGPMGSGKTTVSKLLHAKSQRTVLLGVDKIKWFLCDFDRTSKEDNALIRAVCVAMCKEYLKNGISVIFDNGFRNGLFILPFLKMAHKAGARVYVFRLDASEEVLLDRTQTRAKEILAPDKPSKEFTLGNIQSHREHGYQGKEVVCIDTTKLSPEKIAKLIKKTITE